MNYYLLTAAVLCFLLGVIHSFLGEFLIFKDKRKKGAFIPSQVNQDLKERHLRILWATWHLASVFGWCIGAILMKIAMDPNTLGLEITSFIISSSLYAMIFSSFLVFIGTKGKHPGWVVLAAIGVLLWIGG